VGIDVEQPHLGKQDISRYVLTAEEQAALAELDPASRDHGIMLRFSLKESIYKAIDPYVRRFVGFQEVSVSILPDGCARVDPRLEDGARLHIEGWWTIGQDHVLTVARARPGQVLSETSGTPNSGFP